jgi:hypothetical protein
VDEVDGFFCMPAGHTSIPAAAADDDDEVAEAVTAVTSLAPPPSITITT